MYTDGDTWATQEIARLNRIKNQQDKIITGLINANERHSQIIREKDEIIEQLRTNNNNNNNNNSGLLESYRHRIIELEDKLKTLKRNKISKKTTSTLENELLEAMEMKSIKEKEYNALKEAKTLLEREIEKLRRTLKPDWDLIREKELQSQIQFTQLEKLTLEFKNAKTKVTRLRNQIKKLEDLNTCITCNIPTNKVEANGSGRFFCGKPCQLQYYNK